MEKNCRQSSYVDEKDASNEGSIASTKCTGS